MTRYITLKTASVPPVGLSGVAYSYGYARAALRRHASNGLSHAPVDLVDRLTDHFVRVLR